MKKFHLAQINIAKAKAKMDSEIMKGFVERLDEINQIADQFAGFIWRLQTEDGDSTGIRAFSDPNLIINMSVLKDIKSLNSYVYKSAHVELIRDRQAWFNKMLESQIALWWVPVGHIPSIEEGKQKLDLLDKNRPNENVFTFAKTFRKTI
jgi:hypothetical protein